ncbi:hypothetical protein [uncultured Clostridium sp.]|uniref:hypothetical protein n=1 Tax=uncultured Clostridium sp. TaxID=59620 RepID=UPI0025F99D0D|nr:hypothetical protein [uncultured Clostridium sp.]
MNEKLDQAIEQMVDVILKEYADKVGKQGVEMLKDSFFTVKHGYRVMSPKVNFNRHKTIRRSPFNRSAPGETPAIDSGGMYRSNTPWISKSTDGYKVQFHNSQPYADYFDGASHEVGFMQSRGLTGRGIGGWANAEPVWFTLAPREYFQPVVRKLKEEVAKIDVARIVLEVLGG